MTVTSAGAYKKTVQYDLTFEKKEKYEYWCSGCLSSLITPYVFTNVDFSNGMDSVCNVTKRIPINVCYIRHPINEARMKP